MSTSYYLPAGAEESVFEATAALQLPLMITGPTGCGKTHFVHHMAARLGRDVVTVTCHDDLSSSDLVGRFLVVGGDVQWTDGPLTAAVRAGAICYLDEVVEARRDTLALLHSLTDDRRQLFLERTGEVLDAPSDFMLVCSYNPTSRGVLKELKPSFRQRFVTIGLNYLSPEREAEVLIEETGVEGRIADRLVTAASSMRATDNTASKEAPSTRVLVTAARLIANGLDEATALDVALLAPLSAGRPVEAAMRELWNGAQRAN